MKGSRFNRIVTWNVGLSELEKCDCLSPAVKVSLRAELTGYLGHWIYWYSLWALNVARKGEKSMGAC